MFHAQHCLHTLYTLLISIDSLSLFQTVISCLNQQLSTGGLTGQEQNAQSYVQE